jgi:hypothetical protein
MQYLDIKPGAVSARLKTGVAAAMFALGVGGSGHALAKTTADPVRPARPTEVVLATPAQASAFCEAGSMTKGSVAYINGTAGESEYAKKCTQAVPKKSVKEALLVTGSTVSECKLASAKEAIALCNDGGIGYYDIAYIAGPVATVIGGPGYGCTTNQTTLGIGNAVCK